jgi:hypothetical protein
MNCAEDSPNLGFKLRPSGLGIRAACPDGRWKRGRYRFETRTRHLASDVTSVATLELTRRGAC